MFFVRFYRNDYTTGEPTAEVDFAIVPYADMQSQHEYVTRAASYRPEAQYYRIYEGPNLRMGRMVSLLHELPKSR